MARKWFPIYSDPNGVHFFFQDCGDIREVIVCSTGIPRKRSALRVYRFPKLDESFESQYISWANLNCCGGWTYTESYLDTAVQDGKKLYAGRTTWLKSSLFPNRLNRSDAIAQLNQAKKLLPDDVLMGVESRYDDRLLPTYICRKGCISDYFDLDAVFGFYGKLGVTLSDHYKHKIRTLCSYEIENYGTGKAPFTYYNPDDDAELITTGLLLGYPLESTASLILHG